MDGQDEQDTGFKHGEGEVNHENKNLFNRRGRGGTQRMEIMSKKNHPHWIPACAGMTMEAVILLPPDKGGLRGLPVFALVCRE